jgi:hypothetical protein
MAQIELVEYSRETDLEISFLRRCTELASRTSRGLLTLMMGLHFTMRMSLRP